MCHVIFGASPQQHDRALRSISFKRDLEILSVVRMTNSRVVSTSGQLLYYLQKIPVMIQALATRGRARMFFIIIYIPTKITLFFFLPSISLLFFVLNQKQLFFTFFSCVFK